MKSKMFNYNKICKELTDTLSERTKNVVSRRFGIFGNKKETLEAIGKEYKITRERVRQIERDGIKQIREQLKKHEEVFTFFKNKIDEFGGLKKESKIIEELSHNGDGNYISFLLFVSDGFIRMPGNAKIHALWMTGEHSFLRAQEVINDVYKTLHKENKLLSLLEIKSRINQKITDKELLSFLEISKQIGQNKKGMFGLFNWPEVNPKGIRDRVYLILKEEGRPLHFRDIAIELGDQANPQTTHNELIKDSSFVLIGRGIYALAEWGYVPGEVKEVISEILKEEGSLHKDEIILRVSKKRIVKKNTIIQNLSNKKYFIRTPDGKYTIA